MLRFARNDEDMDGRGVGQLSDAVFRTATKRQNTVSLAYPTSRNTPSTTLRSSAVSGVCIKITFWFVVAYVLDRYGYYYKV